jgi:lipopolysaccharide biosynthesis regulator YciM
VLLAAGAAVYLTFRETKKPTRGDDYLHALEQWIEGNLDEAATLLHRVVHDDPDSVEPFLQLGNLLRLQGDAERAAVLHRSLTVRSTLTMSQQYSLPRVAMSRSRYWKTRFAQWHGLGDKAEAARTLKNAPRQCPENDRPWFHAAYSSYQLDRALAHALAGETSEAKARLKDLKNIAGAQSRIALVRAIMAAVENDAAKAVSIASDSLLNSLEELDVFLPLLQEVLLQSGQFARSLPILERACQAGNAPPSLWIDLAMLYEKLGHRDKALRLLESKSGRRRFTPDSAAPYLKMLVEDSPGSDFGKVWHMLSMPSGPEGWICRQCGQRSERIRWFCPACQGFHTYCAGANLPEVL